MSDTIFREYDIRGIVGQELFLENVYDLGKAIARYFIFQNSSIRCVVVGVDVRTHSPIIKNELCRGLTDSGLDVVSIGLCSTPMLHYAITALSGDAGIMITASHNPKEYNGFKIFLGTQMIYGAALQEIKQIYQQSYISQPHKTQYVGAIHACLIKEQYVQLLCTFFSHLAGSTLPVVFDCANGSAGIIISDLIQIMKWTNMSVLYAEPDGTFPHHHADPIIEDNMKDLSATVRARGAIVGIGFDGDADRMCAVSEDGSLVLGDRLLALFAKDIRNHINDFSVVYDINASKGLEELLNTWGISSIMSPCGHAHIRNHMHKYKALLGGEMSCHFSFEDRGAGSDDGIYAALRLIEILHYSRSALSNLLHEFPVKISSPRYRLPCTEQKKLHLVNSVYEHVKNNPNVNISTMDGVRIETSGAWGLIRASNTQAVLCFSFEGSNYDELQYIQRLVADALATIYYHNLYETFGI